MAELSGPPLRVLLLAPPWYPVPPDGYGGTEEVLAELVEHLLARGHEVTVVGVGCRTAGAKSLTTYDRPQGRRIGSPVVEVAHAAVARRLIDDARPDVVHDHTLVGPLLAPARAAPTLVTVHGRPTEDLALCLEALRDCVDLVAISHAQRRSAPGLPWVATVHNAVSAHRFPFRAAKDDYVMFLGRCSPEKGVHLAVDAARAAGVRLVLAMKCSEAVEREYFETAVRPRLGPHVDYLGEVRGREKLDLLAGARCLLDPVCWDEPFGMVAVEAMACGTPVVGFPRGALTETVVDGETGLLVPGADELPGAVHRAGGISPHACREHVVRRFSGPAMAGGYERAYRAALAARGRTRCWRSRADGPGLGHVRWVDRWATGVRPSPDPQPGQR